MLQSIKSICDGIILPILPEVDGLVRFEDSHWHYSQQITPIIILYLCSLFADRINTNDDLHFLRVF